MATVKVWIPGLLRDFTSGETEFTVSADTVGGALQAAIARHPLLRSHLADEHGRPRPNVNVFHNQEMVRDEAELNGGVADGDRITILQSVSGGSGTEDSAAEDAVCLTQRRHERVDIGTSVVEVEAGPGGR